MKHPFEALQSEYEGWVAHAQIRPERAHVVDVVAQRLIRLWQAGHYKRVSALTGIPILFIAPSFEREASSDFSRSPAQGDRWDRVSVNVPRGVGPFGSWDEAALWSYHHEGLDLVGAANWTWALLCYWSELFNGFGYRDYHHMRTPYVLGATTLQQLGKYTSDGHFEAGEMDEQLGTLAIAMRMAAIAPELLVQLQDGGKLPIAPVPPITPTPTTISQSGTDVAWLQASLNKLMHADLDVDNSYGRMTRMAVLAFQRAHPPLDADGIAGPHTVAVIGALTGEPAPAH